MKFVIPVKNCVITNPFNAPASYPYAPKRKQLHEGIDFAPKIPSVVPVFAAQKGVVFQKSYDARGYGNFVVVKHNIRYYTWYCHLSEVFVSEVQNVDLNTVIGHMGSTGNSTGQHLHFNVQDMVLGLNNYVVVKVVDPKPLLVNTLDNIDILWYDTFSRLFLGSPKLNVRAA